MGDAGDNCLSYSNPYQLDSNRVGTSNECDYQDMTDSDSDGVGVMLMIIAPVTVTVIN